MRACARINCLFALFGSIPMGRLKLQDYSQQNHCAEARFIWRIDIALGDWPNENEVPHAQWHLILADLFSY